MIAHFPAHDCPVAARLIVGPRDQPQTAPVHHLQGKAKMGGAGELWSGSEDGWPRIIKWVIRW